MDNALAIAPPIEKKVKAFEGAGWLAFIEGEMGKAEFYFHEGNLVGHEISEKLYTGLNMLGLGAVARLAGNYKKAEKTFTESISFFEAAESDLNLGWAKYHLGVVCLEQQQYREGITLFTEAVHLFHENKDGYALADTYNFIAHAYFLLREFDKSLEYYNKSGEISNSLGDVMSKTRIDAYVAAVYMEIGDRVKSLIELKKAFSISIELKDDFAIFWGMEQLAQAALDDGEYEKAAVIFSALEHQRQEKRMKQHPGIPDRLEERNMMSRFVKTKNQKVLSITLQI